MVDLNRPGGPDDVKAILRQIKSNLEYQGASVGTLISEVRDSLKGRAENTVKTAIQQEFAELHRDMLMIHDALRGGAMGGGPTTGRTGLAGIPGGGRTDTEALRELILRVQELTGQIAVNGHGFGHGSGGGGGGDPFDSNTLARRYRALDELMRSSEYEQKSFTEKFSVLYNNFTNEGGVMHRQYINRQREAVFSLNNLGAKSLDLIGIFERLGNFVKTQIIDRYGSFTKDRSLGLTGMQTFADDFQRIMQHGFSNMGFGNVVTQDAIKKNAEGGGGPTNLIYGQNISQMAQRFDQIMKQMEAKGVSPMQTFSPQELMQFMQNQANFMKQSQTFDKMRPDQQTELMTRAMVYWSDMAKFTGISAAKLEEMAKKDDSKLNELQALGMVNTEQKTALRQNLQAVETTFGPEMKNLVVDLVRMNQNPTLLLSKNHDFMMANQLSNGSLLPALQQLTALAMKQSDPRTFLQNAAPILNRTQNAMGGDVIAAINAENGKIGSILGTFLGARGLSPEKIAGYDKPSDTDSIRGAAGYFDLMKSQMSQIVSLGGGIVGGIAEIVKFTVELGVASMVLKNFWRSAAGSQVAETGMAAAGRTLGAFGRLAGPVIGGVGGAAAAYASGAPAAGVAGAGIGGFGGAMAGAAMGARFGPYGALIGGAVGGLAGSYGGEQVGTSMSQTQAPAVPAPSNVAGPQAAEVAAATNSSFNDSNLSLLTQLVQTGNQGNYILGQMYGELSRQTGYLRGDPNGAGGGVVYNGQGLAANVSPAISGTRPDVSNPYVGPSA